jgi:hypothetical protein
MNRYTICVMAAAAVAAGCAGNTPPPNDQWAAAQADVGRAQASWAANVPDARLHLQLAVEELQKAKPLIGQDNERATSLTALATADAQLAVSLAKTAYAQQTAHKAAGDLEKTEQGTPAGQ